MRLKSCVVLFAALMGLAGTPTVARAETYALPFVGITFGGDAKSKAVYGGSLMFLGNSAGVELDFGYSPDFFGSDAPNTNVTTVTGSFVVGGNVRGRGVRPFAVVGVGLVRTGREADELFDDISYNDFALSIGGGIHALFSSHVGFRGDVRYFRRLDSPSDNGILPIASEFDFWRATGALSFMF